MDIIVKWRQLSEPNDQVATQAKKRKSQKTILIVNPLPPCAKSEIIYQSQDL